jgi:hypothetical protein
MIGAGMLYPVGNSTQPRTRPVTRFACSAGLLLALSAVSRAADIEPGLYLNTSYSNGYTSIGTVLIGPDHKFALNPRNGIDPFDWEAAAKASPGSVGTFTVVGNSVKVTLASGKTVGYEAEFSGGTFSAFDGGLITKAEAYKKDQTLDQSYGGSIGTENVTSVISLTFKSDGTYTMNRLGAITGGKVGDDTTRGGENRGNASAESTVKGTYKLSGNTLTLTPDGGKAEKHTVLPFNTALDPKKAKIGDDHMIFDSRKLVREK